MDQYLNKWVSTVDGLKATIEVLRKDRDYWKERALSRTINALPALVAFKFYQLRERYRHQQDIEGINRDLSLLEDIEVPDGLDMDAWYEIDRRMTELYEKKGE